MSETASRRHCSTWLHPRDAQWGWWSVSKEFGGGRGLHTQAWPSAAVHRRHVWSFFLEWAEFWPLYWNTDWVQGSQKIRGTLQQYFILISFFFFYDVKRPPFPVWNKTFSLLFLLLTWIKELDLSFLLPSSVSSTHPSAWKSRLGTITEVINSCWAQSASRSLALASALCLLAVHPLPLSFSTRCVAFVFGSNSFSFFSPSQKGVIRRQTKWRSSM